MTKGMRSVCPVVKTGKHRAMELKHRQQAQTDIPDAHSRFAGRPVVAYLAVVLVGFAVLAAARDRAWLGAEDLRASGARHRARRRTRQRVAGPAPHADAKRCLVLALGHRRRLRHPGAGRDHRDRGGGQAKLAGGGFILAAIGVEAATYRATTLVIHRQRPAVPRLDDLPADASYFSGHTAASVAVYCGIALVITRADPQPLAAGRLLDDRGRDPPAGGVCSDVPRHAPPNRCGRRAARRHRRAGGCLRRPPGPGVRAAAAGAERAG